MQLIEGLLLGLLSNNTRSYLSTFLNTRIYSRNKRKMLNIQAFEKILIEKVLSFVKDQRKKFPRSSFATQYLEKFHFSKLNSC